MNGCSDTHNSLVVYLVYGILSVLSTDVMYQFYPGFPHLFGRCLFSVVEHIIAKVVAETFLWCTVCTDVVVYDTTSVSSYGDAAPVVTPLPLILGGGKISLADVTIGLLFTLLDPSVPIYYLI